MNFSKNKKLGRLLSLILTLCLMTTLFAGCFKDDSAEDTSEPNININLEDTPSTEAQTQPTETEPAVINKNMATVTSQMNIRSNPSTDADTTILGTLYAGDKVEVSLIQEVVGVRWAYIKSPMNGWICMDYVEMDYPDETREPDTTTPASATTPTETEAPTEPANTENIKGVINTNGVNIRSEASIDGKVQGSYNKGDVVTILETKNGWGRTGKGWVKMDFVNTSGSTTNNNTDDDKSDNNTSSVTGNGSTTVVLKGVVNTAKLNIRSEASTDADKVGAYVYGDRVEVLEKSNGWGRTSKGWISLSYVYQDGTSGSKTAKGVITAGGGLKIRSGPGTNYDSVGAYAEGDSVTVLEQFTYGGTTWGCTSKGWISMKYVDVGGSGSNDNDDDDDDKLTGTITTNGLRIRSGAGTGYDVVGSLNYGDEVVILSRKTNGDTTWGEIAQGWISMDFVELD